MTDPGRDFFGSVRALLGDRLGECRIEDGHWLCVTVIDRDDEDDAAIGRLAHEVGVSTRVRIDGADPEDLAAWERLRHDLIALRESPREVLRMWPSPNPGYRRPPVQIELHGTAEDVDAELHARYGDFVVLTAGARRYPPGTSGPARLERPARDTVDPRELRIETDGPLVVVPGDGVRHTLLVTVPGDAAAVEHTNGSIFAEIADPSDGRIVGTSSGVRTTALVVHRINPGDTTRIPLFIGTDCLDPALGYVVPPGEWQLVVPLDLLGGRCLEARLPLTIRAH